MYVANEPSRSWIGDQRVVAACFAAARGCCSCGSGHLLDLGHTMVLHRHHGSHLDEMTCVALLVLVCADCGHLVVVRSFEAALRVLGRVVRGQVFFDHLEPDWTGLVSGAPVDTRVLDSVVPPVRVLDLDAVCVELQRLRDPVHFEVHNFCFQEVFVEMLPDVDRVVCTLPRFVFDISPQSFPERLDIVCTHLVLIGHVCPNVLECHDCTIMPFAGGVG